MIVTDPKASLEFVDLIFFICVVEVLTAKLISFWDDDYNAVPSLQANTQKHVATRLTECQLKNRAALPPYAFITV